MRISQIVEDLRSQIVKVRSALDDLCRETVFKQELDHVSGLCTCGIVALYHSIDRIKQAEIAADDAKKGPSLYFAPRGIGLDSVPKCFVCSEPQIGRYSKNISAFVKTKEDGEKVVAWFEGAARLDFRPNEPDWIQVKVGVCKAHEKQLELLQTMTELHCRIRQKDIAECRAFDPEKYLQPIPPVTV